MIVLGLHNGHDPSCAVMIDGRLCLFIEEERLNGIKHGISFFDYCKARGEGRRIDPHRSLLYCQQWLSDHGLKVDEWVATNSDDGLLGRLSLPRIVFASDAVTHHALHAETAFAAAVLGNSWSSESQKGSARSGSPA